MTVLQQLPDANGGNNAWTASAGQRFECVDDPIGSPDGDATYVYYSGTLQGKQTFAFPACGLTTETIVRVRLRGYYKVAGGTVSMDLMVALTGSQDYQPVSVGASYAIKSHIWVNSPFSSVAWTPTELDNSYWGMRTWATGSPTQHRCTQIYREIEYTVATGGVGKLVQGGLVNAGLVGGRLIS